MGGCSCGCSKAPRAGQQWGSEAAAQRGARRATPRAAGAVGRASRKIAGGAGRATYRTAGLRGVLRTGQQGKVALVQGRVTLRRKAARRAGQGHARGSKKKIEGQLRAGLIEGPWEKKKNKVLAN
ncbi:unnamed protein product [Closterium sp. NIES-64]|nr:unnamed protein product [Closterium sp. NIES-64]